MATEKERRTLLREALQRLHPQLDRTGSFNEIDFLHAVGKSSEALLYISLFCPPLVEVDGYVLLMSSVETTADIQRFRNYVQRMKPGTEAVEKSFNFVEVPYMFTGRDTSDEEDTLLAEYMADAWRGWLSTQFPGRRFVVEVVAPDETGGVVGLCFYEEQYTKME